MDVTDVRVVCLSRSAGANGEEIGKKLAERLEFAYLDEEVVALAAERSGIDSAVLSESEAPKSLVARLVEAIDDLAAGGAHLRSSRPSRPRLSTVRGVFREAIQIVADRGSVVIVAHAASLALAGQPGVLRVLITASPEARAERLHGLGLDPGEAETSIAESDRARQQYLEKFYGVKSETPLLYDLVVNTDHLSVDRAVALIAAATRAPT